MLYDNKLPVASKSTTTVNNVAWSSCGNCLSFAAAKVHALAVAACESTNDFAVRRPCPTLNSDIGHRFGCWFDRLLGSRRFGLDGRFADGIADARNSWLAWWQGFGRRGPRVAGRRRRKWIRCLHGWIQARQRRPGQSQDLPRIDGEWGANVVPGRHLAKIMAITPRNRIQRFTAHDAVLAGYIRGFAGRRRTSGRRFSRAR